MTDINENDKEEILKRFWSKLSRIASVYEHSAGLQQELQQEMALAIWQAIDRFRGDSVLDTYLYRIAHNVAVSHIKKQVRQVKTVSNAFDTLSNDSVEKSIAKDQ